MDHPTQSMAPSILKFVGAFFRILGYLGVIAGTLFKILHGQFGNELLLAGLVVLFVGLLAKTIIFHQGHWYFFISSLVRAISIPLLMYGALALFYRTSWGPFAVGLVLLGLSYWVDRFDPALPNTTTEDLIDEIGENR
ncbi:hypothetical protein [Pontibacter sp. G13]|uniref:hypothetical protein n=1 Tax=Pontibacter sp. G13 TaxID=3074898 RepID=UPI002889A813|nr:hypothetical protein [Pontibacter sp. G13]WNJ16728.1 hypothetical protein RJD25_17820 [Pontibacter sp. G13]